MKHEAAAFVTAGGKVKICKVSLVRGRDGWSLRGEVEMTLETSDPALKQVVNSMSAWASADGVEAEYISGGITNRNYCVRVDGKPFFVRLAGEKTEALGIDRDNERSALEAAAEAGMGPEVLAFLPEPG